MVIKEPTYKINGDNLASTSYSGTFKYLGIKFNPNDKTSMNTKDLQDILENLKKAPLKPFQKLDILRYNVIRKLFHHLVPGKITKDLLIKLDDNVRTFVKVNLNLPHDSHSVRSSILEFLMGVLDYLFYLTTFLLPCLKERLNSLRTVTLSLLLSFKVNVLEICYANADSFVIFQLLLYHRLVSLLNVIALTSIKRWMDDLCANSKRTIMDNYG